jgi:Ran GTPase-activating protein (RanGAP) involved in mRNA processing and transport
LNGNQIDAKACEHLAPALKAMTGLEKLYLGGNQIDAKACEYLAPAFKAMIGLKELGLNYTMIDAKGCEHLAPALKAMAGLKTLYLDYNSIPKGSTGFLGMGKNLVGQALMKKAWKKAGKDSDNLRL